MDRLCVWILPIVNGHIPTISSVIRNYSILGTFSGHYIILSLQEEGAGHVGLEGDSGFLEEDDIKT